MSDDKKGKGTPAIVENSGGKTLFKCGKNANVSKATLKDKKGGDK